MNLKESEKQLSLIMIGFLGYMFLPFFYWLWLEHELASGAFPINADSIGIPFAGFVILWFIGLVLIPIGTIFIVCSFRILRRLKEKGCDKEEKWV